MDHHQTTTTTITTTTRHPAALLFLLLLLASVPGQIVQSYNTDRSNQQQVCSHSSTALIPHPTACQRYYDCSDNTQRYHYSLFEKYEKECPHPDLFDVNLKKCVGFEKAECGLGRVAAKWKCDYLVSRCNGPHCRPCIINNPSCVRKTDGAWPNPNKLWSPFFTNCVSERSVHGEESCNVEVLTGKHMIFHPEKRTCVPKWQIPKEHGGYKTSCEGKMQGFYQLDEKWEDVDHIAYRCPDEAKFFCKTPFMVHHDIYRCVALN